MQKGIIQHHEIIDLKAFYNTIKAGNIGIDRHDFETFLRSDGEKHSFIGVAKGTDRVKDAIESIMASNIARDVVTHASSILISVIRSPASTQPIQIQEMQYLNEFIANLPEGCDIAWSLVDDSDSGDTV